MWINQQTVEACIAWPVMKLLSFYSPFANAFNFNASGRGHQDDIRWPSMTAEVFEGKYELDSLAAVMKLANTYWKETKDPLCFLKRQQWSEAMRLIISTIKSMQQATSTPSASPYRFQRVSPAPTESQMLSGMGSPTAYTGMSCSPFRPSDDSTLLPYLIPTQAMTVVELRAMSKMIEEYLQHEMKGRPVTEWSQEERHQANDLKQIASDASALASEIDHGIHEYGIVSSRKYGDIFAYEVDGFGGTTCMDDANIPSLLSSQSTLTPLSRLHPTIVTIVSVHTSLRVEFGTALLLRRHSGLRYRWST